MNERKKHVPLQQNRASMRINTNDDWMCLKFHIIRNGVTNRGTKNYVSNTYATCINYFCMEIVCTKEYYAEKEINVCRHMPN